VCSPMRDFVVFNYHQSGNQQVNSEEVEREMRECSASFLNGSVCGLENEDGLREGEERG